MREDQGPPRCMGELHRKPFPPHLRARVRGFPTNPSPARMTITHSHKGARNYDYWRAEVYYMDTNLYARLTLEGRG